MAQWLISTLPLAGLNGSSGTIGDVAVSRSTDGLTWGNPIIIDKTHLDDKNWTVCDNTTTSPYYGNCYTEWDQAYGTRRCSDERVERRWTNLGTGLRFLRSRRRTGRRACGAAQWNGHRSLRRWRNRRLQFHQWRRELGQEPADRQHQQPLRRRGFAQSELAFGRDRRRGERFSWSGPIAASAQNAARTTS